MMRRWWVWLAALLAVIVAVFAVVAYTPLRQRIFGDQIGPNPEPIAGAQLGGTGPGGLVSAMTMPGFSRTQQGKNIRAARVVYRSTSADTGAATEVSGSVFVPTGSAPSGGWPVIGFAHGTLGIDKPCAPSLSDGLLGLSDPVAGLVAKGFAVALPDYQGLGTDGVHPYTDARTAGRNLIDAVSALRSTFSDVSARWVAFGGSQGGGASWAADEEARNYRPDLDLLGAVAVAPAADVTGLVDKAAAGTLTVDQGPAYLLIVESLARLHPELNRDDYRRGAAATYWDTLIACSGPRVTDRDAAIKQLTAEDLKPASPEAADKLRTLLRQWALPQQPLTAPLSVVYGDKDTFIDYQWTTDAIAKACAMGGVVDWTVQPGKGHGDLDFTEQFVWVADRFSGTTPVNDCT